MLIIAEAGSSPAPAFDFARWCEGARAVGADAIKMQLFLGSHFPEAEQAEKQKLEFPRERLAEYMLAAHAFGLAGGVSVFDADAALLAANECDYVKLGAREESNWELAGTTALLCDNYHKPLYRSISDFKHFSYFFDRDTVHLFALQSYPAGMIQSVVALLRAAAFFRSRRVRWGWSSHTLIGWDCVLAARLGACVIEKHICFSTDDIEGGHSLLPHQFARMVERIKS